MRCSELREAVERKRRLGSTPNLEAMRQTGPAAEAAAFPLSAERRAQPGIYASAQTMPREPFGRAFSTPFRPGQSPASARNASQPALFGEEARPIFFGAGRSIASLPRGYSELAFAADQRRLLDAKSVRLQEHQLEERSRALEEQNKQLQVQLDRLQKMVDKVRRPV